MNFGDNDTDALPGPSARFPLYSRLLPMYALWEVSHLVGRSTGALVWRARKMRKDKEKICVDWYFDLRMHRDFWRCHRCGATQTIEVPGELDARWLPRADKETLVAYGEIAAAFVDAHVNCESGKARA